MNVMQASGRAAAVVVLAIAALVVGGRVARARRADPIPVSRCPIHGIAFDAELEVCPDCAKTDAAGRKGGTR